MTLCCRGSFREQRGSGWCCVTPRFLGSFLLYSEVFLSAAIQDSCTSCFDLPFRMFALGIHGWKGPDREAPPQWICEYITTGGHDGTPAHSTFSAVVLTALFSGMCIEHVLYVWHLEFCQCLWQQRDHLSCLNSYMFHDGVPLGGACVRQNRFYKYSTIRPCWSHATRTVIHL